MYGVIKDIFAAYPGLTECPQIFAKRIPGLQTSENNPRFVVLQVAIGDQSLESLNPVFSAVLYKGQIAYYCHRVSTKRKSWCKDT